MEKRKAEIITNFNSIVQQKDSLISNLNAVTKEIESSIQIMNTANPEYLKRTKHLLNVSKYQLSLMKVLSEMTYLLDSFVEDEELPSNDCTRPSTSMTNFSRTSSICESHVDDRVDITVLKEQFQQLTEKIQTNCPAVIDYVTDFYKSSAGNTRFANPAQSLGSNSIQAHDASSFEVPEKDLTANNVNDDPQDIPNNLIDVASCSQHMPEIKHEIQESHSLIDLSNCVAQNVASSSNVPPENSCFQTIEQAENNSEIKPVYGVDESESDPELIEILDDKNSASSKTTSETTSVSSEVSLVFSAVDKLNNARIFDRREDVKSVPKPNVPDLALKPSSDDETTLLVRNSFHKNRKLKKKKNIKQESSNEEIDLPDFLTPETNQECAFSHIESPSEFYIHLVNQHVDCIDTIAKQIGVYYNDSSPHFRTKLEAKARIRKYCVAYIDSSKQWFRVEVLDWFIDNTPKTDDVLLHLVDFGDKQKVSFSALRMMPQEVVNVPKLAVKCCLVRLFPPGSTPTNLLTEWPHTSIEALGNLSGIYLDDSCKLFRILYANRVGDLVEVDLMNDLDEDTVGQILLDLNVAVQILDEDCVVDEDENLTTFLTDVNNLEQAENLTEAIQGYDAKDEARICKFSRIGKKCFKGDKCPFEHIDISKGNDK